MILKGTALTCDGCGSGFVYRGRMIESVHASGVDFCTRRCFFACLRRGGVLRDGRRILLIFGQTPAEHLAELARRVRH